MQTRILGLVTVGLLTITAVPVKPQTPQDKHNAPAKKMVRPGRTESVAPTLPGRWAPPDVDEAVPPVTANVACSLPEVLSAVGQRLQELVTNLQQFTGVGRVEHWDVNGNGNLSRPLARTFNYLVSISQIRPGFLSVDETRNGGALLHAFPTKLASLGMVATVLIFHPYYVGDYDVSCEGLGEWRGQPTWQVHFRQRPDRPARMRSYRIQGKGHPVKLKGRAWIAADTYQVLHMETDLAEPLPEIRLQTEHLSIDYRPVQFQKKGIELWLPESADLYFDFRSHRYRHRHTFSEYMLFSVDTREQIQEPPQP